MRFSTALLLVPVGLAAAQAGVTTSAVMPGASGTSGYHCDAENIVDACLKSEQAKVDACEPNAWGCLCTAQKAVLTCYNNCPGDPRRFGAEQQETSWCAAAQAVGTTSVMPSMVPTGTPKPKSGGGSGGSGGSGGRGGGSGGSSGTGTTGGTGGGSTGGSSGGSSGGSDDTSSGDPDAASALLPPIGGLAALAIAVTVFL